MNKEKLLRAEPGGFAGFTFVAVDAIEARGADAEAGCDAEPAVHAARNTQGWGVGRAEKALLVGQQLIFKYMAHSLLKLPFLLLIVQVTFAKWLW